MKKVILLAVCLVGFASAAHAGGGIFLQPKVDPAIKAPVQLKPAPETGSPCELAKDHLRKVLAGFEANCTEIWEALAERVVDDVSMACEQNYEGELAEALFSLSQFTCENSEFGSTDGHSNIMEADRKARLEAIRNIRP